MILAVSAVVGSHDDNAKKLVDCLFHQAESPARPEVTNPENARSQAADTTAAAAGKLH